MSNADELLNTIVKGLRFTSVADLDHFCTPQMATRIRAAIDGRELGRPIEIVDGKVLD